MTSISNAGYYPRRTSGLIMAFFGRRSPAVARAVAVLVYCVALMGIVVGFSLATSVMFFAIAI